MKILIGTPIHQVKDYAMERWLENVSKLLKESPTDFLMVDNSPGLGYVEKVKGYCKKYGIKNYQIKHLDMTHDNGADERIGRSREVIRQEVLTQNYDAWFSWESDQLIPPDALTKLVMIMEAGNYMMISHNSWSREIPTEPMAAFGCALISRKVLEKYGFLLEYPDMPNIWHGGDVWFKKQVIKGGGNYVEVYGAIGPIYHLNE